MTYMSAEVRRLVSERAGNCCEYCLLSQEDNLFAFHIDHVISEKHGGSNNNDNLCLSCPSCNTYKGSDVGSIDRQTNTFTALYNPRLQIWSEHFQLNEYMIEPLTPEGRVTAFLLRLNNIDRLMERKSLLDLGRYPCKK